MNPADEPVVTTTRSGSTVTPCGLGVVPRDALAQRRDAERLGVADVAEVERRLRGPRRGARRGRGRLADLHMHDAPAARLDARGRRHHVHHHEGRNIAARRRGDQAPRLVQHHSVFVFPDSQSFGPPR